MTDTPNTKPTAQATPPAGAKTDGQPANVTARAVAQYIRDLSFENPSVEKQIASQPEAPQMKIELNVSGKPMGKDLYESSIELKATASGKVGTIYILELTYAGLFKLENIPPQALEPILLVNCPMLIFPFARRVVADLTREGGYPPLLLDPVDFAQLYFAKQKQVAAAKAGGGTPPVAGRA
ncbi:MAG TPA: protein-export chaperone SecB [Hyphomicrobiaceae bacterium]|nr:protein-export chaperone SecB [Hyphomicrobiaceae bacterium]